MDQGPLAIIHAWEEAYRASRKQEPPIMRYSKGWFNQNEFSYRAKEIVAMAERFRREINACLEGET